VAFGQDQQPLSRDLAKLHAQLLPESPIALLGLQFMEKFYYNTLPRDGHISGAVAYVENKPAGFVVVAHNPDGFLAAAFRQSWLRIAWIMRVSVLKSPGILAAVWNAMRIMKNRGHREADSNSGEILSMGVLPEYRDPKFLRKYRIAISKDLLNQGVAQLEARGKQKARAVVAATNTPVKLFYSSLGWKVAGKDVGGWRHSTLEFELELRNRAEVGELFNNA
jgi:ribosomal protein S18 acetylase RimI-like enzyme